MTSLPLEVRFPSSTALQPAVVLIQAERYQEAHLLLLKLARSEPHNPRLWLMLAWTAPSPASALEYYRKCILIDPTNELARSGITASLTAQRQSQPPQAIIDKSVVAPPVPASPPALVFEKIPVQSMPGAFLGAAYKNVVRFPWLVILYMLILATAELLTSVSNPQVGLTIHGMLMVVLFLHASLTRVRAQRRFLFSLALAPLIRLLSLSMPLGDFQFTYWYAIIGLPLFIAAYLVYRLSAYTAADVGLSLRKLPLQFSLGFLGLALGYVEYLILKPAPLVQSLDLSQMWLPALILLIFTGFLEEFIFRGLMQRAAVDVLGKYGIFYISLLFAVLHIGYRSFLDFAFVLVVGLSFAVIVKRTRSIWGVTLAHGLTNIALYLIFPLL